MASDRLPADMPVDAATVHAAVDALMNEDHTAALAWLGTVLRPFAPLPPSLRREPPGPPRPPADLLRRVGPWQLLRDPARPCVGDAAVLSCQLMHRTGDFADLRTWVATVGERGLVRPDERRPAIELAGLEHREGRMHEARAVLARELREHGGMPADRRAYLLNLLAITVSDLGEWRRSRDIARDALALARASRLTWELPTYLLTCGLLEVRSFDLAEGAALLTEAAERCGRSQRWVIAAHIRINLAIALYKQGRLAEAHAELDTAERGLLGRLERQSWLQARLARCKVHLVAGEAAAALAIAREVEAETSRRGLGREHGLAVEMQGDAQVLAGDLAAAERHYREADAMARHEAPEGDLAAGLARRLGQVTMLSGDPARAVVHLADAERLSLAAGEAFEAVVSARLLAEAHLALDEPHEGRAAARRAVTCGRRHGCDLELARSLLTGARAEARVAAAGKDGSRESAWSGAAEARLILRRLGFERDVAGCDRFLARLREDWRAAWVWAGGPPPPESLGDVPQPAFVAGSPAMVAAAGQMAVASSSADPVLIGGETGTGKEVAARRIHALSDRRRGPLVSVNCAAVPADLFEREFFGHAPGAFTGAEDGARGLVEQAHRGTLFLDEVGDLPLALQAKLLRVLQEGTYRRLGDPAERRVDLRVIAATNIDLGERMAAGSFRRDLFYRLSVLEVWLPPLRERVSDLPALVRAFVRRGLGDDVELVEVLPALVLAACERYGWPGNVRELEALVRRACLYRRTGQAMPRGLLPVGLRRLVEELEPEVVVGEGVAEGSGGQRSLRLEARLMVAEREAVRTALREASGNRSQAAELLGVSRKSLYAKLRRLGLDAGVAEG